MIKIAIIGNFGNSITSCGGQDVKTRMVADELTKTFGEEAVVRLNVASSKFMALFFPFEAFCRTRCIVMMTGQNGLKWYPFVFSFLHLIFRQRQFHYVVIGGWLPDYVTHRPFLRRCLKKFDGIYVETKGMVEKMNQQGFPSIYLMPNCKHLTILKPQEEINSWQGVNPIPVCTFSRVSRTKGIEEAIKSVMIINERAGYTKCRLDIFGAIQQGEEAWFGQLQNSFPSYIKYKEAVPYTDSVKILKNYYALLFPTYYEGEGFPGTLIDAMAAGLPIIASRWKYNEELIDEGKTGLLVSPRNCEQLADSMEWLIEHQQIRSEMSDCCLQQATHFMPENGLQILKDRIGEIDKTHYV